MAGNSAPKRDWNHLKVVPSEEGPVEIGVSWGAPRGLVTAVQAGAAVELLYVHVPFAVELDDTEKERSYDHLVESVGEALTTFLSGLDCAYGIERWPADDFVAWLADSPHRPLRPIHSPDELTSAAGVYIRESLTAQGLHPSIRSRSEELSVARARMPFAPDADIHRGYARTLRTAQRDACDPVARQLQQCTEDLDEALARRAFEFHYQPIVDIHDRSVLAYEALCRGTSVPLRFPDVIFGAAERCDRVWELGRVLRDIVADDFNRPEASDESLLVFINVHPRDIDDPVFLEQALSGPLTDNAHRIVIELTERAAIEDYRRVKAFFATLRRRGYRLAIDDLGSGYAGLTALAELEPDFIKFDMGLIRDLHLQPVKQRLINRMNEFAQEIGAQTISEGVECAEERDALLAAGCRIMQGYFFARPGPGRPQVPPKTFE